MIFSIATLPTNIFPFFQSEERNEELHNKHGSEAFEYLEVDCYLLTENQIWKLESFWNFPTRSNLILIVIHTRPAFELHDDFGGLVVQGGGSKGRCLDDVHDDGLHTCEVW